MGENRQFPAGQPGHPGFPEHTPATVRGDAGPNGDVSAPAGGEFHGIFHTDSDNGKSDPDGAAGPFPAPALLALGDVDRDLRGFRDRLEHIAGEVAQAYVRPGNASAHQLDLEARELQRIILRVHAKLHAFRRTLKAPAAAETPAEVTP